MRYFECGECNQLSIIDEWDEATLYINESNTSLTVAEENRDAYASWFLCPKCNNHIDAKLVIQRNFKPITLDEELFIL